MATVTSPVQSIPVADRVVCHCYGVRESVIRQAIDEQRSTTVAQVSACTKAGKGCHACLCRIKRMLAGQSAQCGVFDVCGQCGFFASRCACKAA